MATFDDIAGALRDAGFVVTGTIDVRREPVEQIYTCRRSAMRVMVPTAAAPRSVRLVMPYPDQECVLVTDDVHEALRRVAQAPDRAPLDLPQTPEEIAANVAAWIEKLRGN